MTGPTITVRCGRCDEHGEGEYRIALRLPDRSGYLDPVDWTAGVDAACPVCSWEPGEELVYEAFLELCNDAVRIWSQETGWSNYHGSWTPANWSGHCDHVAGVLAGFFGGRGDFGTYHGKMSELTIEAFWECHERGVGCNHSWIRLADGRILDPTRWAFHDDLVEIEDEDEVLDRVINPRVRFYLTDEHDPDYRRPIP